MRDHTKQFVREVAESFDCPGPIYEFGSFQVEGQEQYADLRSLFPGKKYVGCDMRPGLGVDLVQDVSAMTIPSNSVGTVLCIETFEHVFEVRKAFDEVFRVLKPGGLFIITSPLNFRIHAYPDDYWRMTPTCLRRLLSPYEAKACGFQGFDKFPHTVMAVSRKSPAESDFSQRALEMQSRYDIYLGKQMRLDQKQNRLKRLFSRLHRSKAERYHMDHYYCATFQVDQAQASTVVRRHAG
jgi:SAM-dependent methyltransferase